MFLVYQLRSENKALNISKRLTNEYFNSSSVNVGIYTFKNECIKHCHDCPQYASQCKGRVLTVSTRLVKEIPPSDDFFFLLCSGFVGRQGIPVFSTLLL